MAYDRYDTRNAPPNERTRWRNERGNESHHPDDDRSSHKHGHGTGGPDDRGFFERAGDEIASWFGDEDADRRRHRELTSEQRSQRNSSGSGDNRALDHDRSYRQDFDPARNETYDRSDNRNTQNSAFSSRTSGQDRNNRGDDERGRHGGDRNEDQNVDRGLFAQGGSSERDYDPRWRQDYSDRDSDPSEADQRRDRGWTDRYQDTRGDYGANHRSSPGRGREFEESQSKWAQDEYRGTSRAGSANWSDRSREDQSDQSRTGHFDPHYRSWRDRHLSELDRDYDDFRAEHQSRFESDFGSWRERRQQKRGLLSQIREQMEVVGSDGKHVGRVEETAGDRLMLTKSDPESGGIHHSISGSDVERIEGDRVILDCTADQARQRWRDESRGDALSGR